MKNKNKCEKCHKPDDLTRHHLFNYYQVRRELLKIYETPKNEEEYTILCKKVMNCWKALPKITLCHDCHQELEKNKKEITLKRLWR